MPAIPRRRLPGTLAKNNTVNEIIDYLGGNSSPENATGQLDSLARISPGVFARVVKQNAVKSNVYECEVMYVQAATAAGAQMSFGVDKGSFNDTINVHVLLSVHKTGDTVDLSSDDVGIGVPTLSAGDFVFAVPFIRPSSTEAAYDNAWVAIAPPQVIIWGKTTNTTEISSNRWQYAWSQYRRTSNGFEQVSGGFSGTTDTRFAINSLESQNAGSGMQGNGVNVDNLPAGFSLQPVTGVVPIWVGSDKDGKVAFTFCVPNGVDGVCS